HHQENRRGRKDPDKNLADTPVELVRWQQQASTNLSHVWDQEQESKRCKVHLPGDQCYRVDHCKKSASDTKDGAGAKGASRNDKFPERGGGKSSDRCEA